MTAQSPSFSSILDRQATEIEPPKQVPIGDYVCIIKSRRYDKSSKKGTDFVEYTLQPVEAMESVDQEQLAEVGGFADKTFKLTFYLTEDAAYRLKDFLADDLGIDAEDRSLRMMIEDAIGSSVIATIGHEISQDGKRFRAVVKSTTKYGE